MSIFTVGFSGGMAMTDSEGKEKRSLWIDCQPGSFRGIFGSMVIQY